MTQHKVISDDSFSAMDEISKVLGNEAVILSTKKVGNKVEIIGSNDIKDILKSNKRSLKKKNFKELFSKVPLSNFNPSINKFDKSNITLNEANNNNTSDMLEKFKDEIKNMLSEIILSDLSSINSKLEDNEFIKLLQNGYSKNTVNSIFNEINKLEKPKSIVNFYNHLSKMLVYDIKERLDNCNTFFITGLTGVGKTTMCAKIASYFLDHSKHLNENKNVILINLSSGSPNMVSNLVNYGRVLNINVHSFTNITDLDKFILENKSKKIIVDVSKDLFFDKIFLNYMKSISLDNFRLHLNVISSGINYKNLEYQSDYMKDLNPIFALTKLDETIINPSDFSMYYDLNCRLGILSGTKNIIDAIAFANHKVLAQYMKEN